MQNKLIVKKINKKYLLRVGKKTVFCQLGKTGIKVRSKKIEGDGATPAGKWRLKSIYYRSDRVLRSKLKKQYLFPPNQITKDCGWCDDINSNFYNKYIQLENHKLKKISYERLWRNDFAYDIFITLDYNINPIISNKGSAIFIHCSFDDNRPTSGCIALPKHYLIEIIKNLKKKTLIII